jgi:anti-sigma-K factor RskA
VIPFDDIVQQRGTLPASYVGLLTDADGAPTVLASSTRHGRTMTFKFLKPVAPPPGKRLVLWALPKDGAPFALGAIPPPDGNRSVLTMSGHVGTIVVQRARLAVSFEDVVPAPGATRRRSR